MNEINLYKSSQTFIKMMDLVKLSDNQHLKSQVNNRDYWKDLSTLKYHAKVHRKYFFLFVNNS